MYQHWLKLCPLSWISYPYANPQSTCWGVPLYAQPCHMCKVIPLTLSRGCCSSFFASLTPVDISKPAVTWSAKCSGGPLMPHWESCARQVILWRLERSLEREEWFNTGAVRSPFRRDQTCGDGRRGFCSGPCNHVVCTELDTGPWSRCLFSSYRVVPGWQIAHWDSDLLAAAVCCAHTDFCGVFPGSWVFSKQGR